MGQDLPLNQQNVGLGCTVFDQFICSVDECKNKQAYLCMFIFIVIIFYLFGKSLGTLLFSSVCSSSPPPIQVTVLCYFED